MWRLLPLSLLLSLSAGCALLRGSPEPDPMSAQEEEDWEGMTAERAGKKNTSIEVINLSEDDGTSVETAPAHRVEARVESSKLEAKAVKTPKPGKARKAAVESVAVAEKVAMPAVQGSLASSAVPLTPVTPAYP